MSTKMNEAAYRRLIDEDIAWLDKQSDTLEADHIRQVLKDTIRFYYPDEHRHVTWDKQGNYINVPGSAKFKERIEKLRAAFGLYLTEETRVYASPASYDKDRFSGVIVQLREAIIELLDSLHE